MLPTANLWFAALPILRTEYPVAITGEPGPGFNFEATKEKNNNEVTCIHI